MAFGELLRKLLDERALVDIRRDAMNVDDIRGFVADISDELVLIAAVADDIRTDGYRIINRDDITLLRWSTGKMKAWERVIGFPDADVAAAPGLDLSDWRAAIASLEPTVSLLTFHRERMDHQTCYIARNFELTYDLIVGVQVTTEGEENGSFAIRVEDITRLDFGAGYERRLNQILSGT
jgi:hypothetical protein